MALSSYTLLYLGCTVDISGYERGVGRREDKPFLEGGVEAYDDGVGFGEWQL